MFPNATLNPDATFRPPSSLSYQNSGGYADPQQLSVGTASSLANGAFSYVPSSSGAVDPSAMYAQQQVGGGQQWPGQPQGQPLYASPSAFAANPAISSYPTNNAGLSTSNLLAQQLAQQQALAQQGTPQGGVHNNQLTPQQAYLLQARRAQQEAGSAGGGGGGGLQMPQRYDAFQGQPQGAPSPAYPPTSQPPSAQSLDPRQVLQSMNIQGLTAEKYHALAPAQQAVLQRALRHQQQQRQQQQQQLGMGFPGSPANSAGGGGVGASSVQNGTPSPMGGAPGTPGGAGYGRPAGQGQQALGTPQGQPQQSNNMSGSNTTFYKAIVDFYAKRGTPFPGPPIIEGKVVDITTLYVLVMRGGGFPKVHANQQWRPIVHALGFPAESSAAQPDTRVQAIAQAYHSIIYPFEAVLRHQQQQREQAAQAAQQNAAGAPPPPPLAPAFPSPLPLPPPPALPAFAPQDSPRQLPQALNDRSASRTGFYGQSSGGAAGGGANFAGVQQSPNQTMGLSGQQGMGMGMPIGVGDGGSQNRSGTPAMATLLEDRKGKGKAKEMDRRKGPIGRKVGQDDFDDSPAAPPTTVPTPSTSASLAPIQQGSDSSLLDPSVSIDDVGKPAKPDKSTVAARRKRQKIAYVPLARSVDTYASWDLGQVEEQVQMGASRKRPRQAMDLGTVDVHGLVMSLRCRMASEVTFALNSLTLISLAMKSTPNDPHGIPFPLASCGALLDELVDLLEETASGIEDEFGEEDYDEASTEDDPPGSKPSQRSYRELFRLVVQEETELLEPVPSALKTASRLADDGLTPLGPVETILAITNLLRNFSVSEDNARTMASRLRVVEVLVRVASLPLRRDGAGRGRWPLRVSAGDSMALRKDILETVNNFGLDIRLEDHKPETASALFHHLLFFLTDADHHDQLYFDLSTSPSVSSRIPQPGNIRLSHYLELGLAAFARITLRDANRYVVARLSTTVDLFALFESLIHHLPVTEADFQLVTSEAGLVFVENLAMSLYNLAFLAPVDLKLRLRVVPGFVKGLLRVVRRLAGTTGDHSENAFLILSDRCIATLQILSEMSGVSGGQLETSDTLWWGLAMGGEEEDRPTQAQPTEADRATVKQKMPPSSSTRAAGPPILTGETRVLFELFSGGSLPAVGGVLASLCDGTSERAV